MIPETAPAGNDRQQSLLPYFQNLPENIPLARPHLAQLAQAKTLLPQFVRECRTATRYLALLGPLDWEHFPQRDPHRAWPGPKPHPRAAYVGAFLIKVNQNLRYMSDLREYLVEHPALVWILGFNLVPDATCSCGFDVEASLPTARHFGRVLRELPNDALQFLLTATVHILQAELPAKLNFGQKISLDTKAILAWVKENNPKDYIKESDRLNKRRQPQGDPDCKLGCKRKANRPPASARAETTPANITPTKNPVAPTNFSSSDEYYWGYASGVVAAKVPAWGEFVLAEMTQTFDKGDATYFFPLMKATEERLGFKPPFGALDCSYDTFYVHEYFDTAGGFAAVPFAKRGKFFFEFDEQGLPLCKAGLPMPLKSTYISRTSEVEHQMGRCACPLLFPFDTQDRPGANGNACPVAHKNWQRGGCVTTMATSKGARLRYQLDRESEDYKELYKQRTATERINSQAKELGIERPKLRNQQAITNQNTLLYVIINLRALQRLRKQKAELAQSTQPALAG